MDEQCEEFTQGKSEYESVCVSVHVSTPKPPAVLHASLSRPLCPNPMGLKPTTPCHQDTSLKVTPKAVILH